MRRSDDPDDHMKTRPYVSVGLAVYNGERFLVETLDSILGQSLSDFEVIISDNGSTDATEQICLTYAAQNPHVRYYREEKNRGFAWNYNRLPALAEGKYFKWADADDLLEPSFLARCVDVLDQRADVVLAYTHIAQIDETGKPMGTRSGALQLSAASPYDRLKIALQHGGHWASADPLFGVMRRDRLLKTRLMPCYHGGDKACIAELSLQGQFFEIPAPLFLRRHHPSAQSYNTADLKWLQRFFKSDDAAILLPTWSLYRDHMTTIRKAALTRTEKVQLLAALLRAAKWNARTLLNEVGHSFRHLGVAKTSFALLRGPSPNVAALE